MEKNTKICVRLFYRTRKSFFFWLNCGIIWHGRGDFMYTLSRYGSGVRVMKLKDNDQVVTVARAEQDSNAEISEVEKADESEADEKIEKE